jgi:hypothetical protein
MSYEEGSIRRKTLVEGGPEMVKNWPFPLPKEDKIFLMTQWADEGTFSDLDALTVAEVNELWNNYING